MVSALVMTGIDLATVGHMKRRALVLGMLLALPVAPWGSLAFACSPGRPAPTAAFPASGALSVSPQSSIFIVAGNTAPAGLTLRANGAPISPPPTISSLGFGLTPGGPGTFYRLAGPLQPSTDYSLEVEGAAGEPVELTHFSTAATYDKTAGVPPTIGSLRLWRVHYPVSLVGAGGCVFSEYEGYFALDFTPGSVPGTPDAEVVSVLTLSSMQLGTTQSFVFQGITTLPGGFRPAVDGDGVVLPEGGELSASAALWKPNLEPGRTFCASITSYGRNDLAAPLLQSPSVCATVLGIEAAGAGGAGGMAGTGGTGAYPIGNDVASSGGCSVASGHPPGAGDLLIAGLAATLLARRRRSRSQL